MGRLAYLSVDQSFLATAFHTAFWHTHVSLCPRTSPVLIREERVTGHILDLIILMSQKEKISRTRQREWVSEEWKQNYSNIWRCSKTVQNKGLGSACIENGSNAENTIFWLPMWTSLFALDGCEFLSDTIHLLLAIIYEKRKKKFTKSFLSTAINSFKEIVKKHV